MKLPRIQPINPRQIAAPFDDESWIFELKMDGWRCTAYVEDGACELVSRNGNVYKSFARLTNEVAKLPVKRAIIDSEVVCLDDEGRSIFLDLMRRHKAAAILYCFDLLWLDDKDLRTLPLIERKRTLKRLIRGHAGLLLAEHIEAKGRALFEAACAKDLEGIVCKHKLAPYTISPAVWFKVLNPHYTQKRGRREMFDKFRDRREAVLPSLTARNAR